MKKKNSRLICVSSIFQLLVAHSCLKHQKNKKLNNIIVLTTANLHKDNLLKFKNVTKKLGYKNIVDFSNIVKNLNIKNVEKAQKIIKNKFLKITINEILIRYKFNLFEHTLFCSFNKADISIFEDGIGDYLKKKLLTGSRKNNHIKQKIRFIYHKFKNQEILINYYSNNLYKNRINKKYELIKDYKGDLKSQHISKKPFLFIKKTFLKILKKFKIDKIKTKTILFLMHDIDELNDPARINKEEFKKNINFYIRAKKIVQKKFPSQNILFKTHPNIRKSTIKTLEKKYNFNCFAKNFIAEMMFQEKNITCVVGFASSSLLYSKKIFKKKTISFNTNHLNFHAVNDQKISIFDVLNRFKIDIIQNL